MGLRFAWIVVLAGCLSAGEGLVGVEPGADVDDRPPKHGPVGDGGGEGEGEAGSGTPAGSASTDGGGEEGGGGGDVGGSDAAPAGGDGGGEGEGGVEGAGDGAVDGAGEGGDDGSADGDEFPSTNDRDGDGVIDEADNCPDHANPDQRNTDGPLFRCRSEEACLEMTGCRWAEREGRGYLHCPTPTPWLEARERCLWVGGDLAIPDTPEESEFLAELNAGAWIGISDLEREGDFVAVDGGALPYDGWGPRQPDDWQEREDCVHLQGSPRWNDADCGGERVFLCEERAPELGDGGDACDPCPERFDPLDLEEGDLDEDGLADSCDSDMDGDGVDNAVDNCPETPNPDQANSDGGGGFPCAEGDCLDAIGCRRADRDGAAYLACGEPVTWHAADDFCREVGGWLVAIDGRSENSDVGRLGLESFWIGLNDQEEEGAHVWSNGDNSRFRRWNRDEPNDYGDGEDCVEMLENGRWNDQRCESERPFVCEAEDRGGPDAGDACQED